MTPKGFVVEFIGLPGVGKTTLALEVVRLLDQDLPVQLAHSRMSGRRWAVRRLHSTCDIVGLTLRHPYYVFRTARAIRASGQRSLYDGIKVTNNWLSVSSLTVESNRVPRVTLFDQGMYQALWSVGYRAERAGRLERLTALGTLMPKPDLLVLLSADLNTVLRRLQARGGRESRMDVVTRAEVPRFQDAQLQDAAALLGTVVAIARAGGVKLLEVNGDDDSALGATARAVADVVRMAVQPARSSALTDQGKSLSV